MGIFILDSRLPDDFGNMYCPWTSKYTDNFGNLFGEFSFPWFDQRYYFYNGI